MTTSGFHLREGPALLGRTPAVLDALLHGLPAAWADCSASPTSNAGR